MEKEYWKSFRTDKTDRARLKALKKAGVALYDSDLCKMGLECLCREKGVTA